MAYALVCDVQYVLDAVTGAHVCNGGQSQIVIDPLVALDASVGAAYLGGGFGVGLAVFSMAWGARQLIRFIQNA